MKGTVDLKFDGAKLMPRPRLGNVTSLLQKFASSIERQKLFINFSSPIKNYIVFIALPWIFLAFHAVLAIML